MKVYTFRGANGDLITIKAHSESEARSEAMEQRWGPPTGIYAPFYCGRGLDLIDDRPDVHPAH